MKLVHKTLAAMLAVLMLASVMSLSVAAAPVVVESDAIDACCIADGIGIGRVPSDSSATASALRCMVCRQGNAVGNVSYTTGAGCPNNPNHTGSVIIYTVAFSCHGTQRGCSSCFV